MKKFDTGILDALNKECRGEPINFVGLGAHNFQLSFGGLQQIQTEEKAAFLLNEKSYTWSEGPTEVPVWLLVGQTPISFRLPDPFTLRMCLKSGDFVEFYTAQHEYESTVINFGEKEGMRVVKVF